VRHVGHLPRSVLKDSADEEDSETNVSYLGERKREVIDLGKTVLLCHFHSVCVCVCVRDYSNVFQNGVVIGGSEPFLFKKLTSLKRLESYRKHPQTHVGLWHCWSLVVVLL
jgi:hypothetical protein